LRYNIADPLSNTAPGGNEADTDKKMGRRDREEEVEKIRGMAPDVPEEAARFRYDGRLSFQPVAICCVPPLADAAAVDAIINFCSKHLTDSPLY